MKKTTECENENKATESLIKFPEKFPIKVFGLDSPELEIEVRKIIEKFTAEKDIIEWHINPSKNNKYIAITITIMAQNQKQLDDIYMQITANKLVTMAL